MGTSSFYCKHNAYVSTQLSQFAFVYHPMIYLDHSTVFCKYHNKLFLNKMFMICGEHNNTSLINNNFLKQLNQIFSIILGGGREFSKRVSGVNTDKFQ